MLLLALLVQGMGDAPVTIESSQIEKNSVRPGDVVRLTFKIDIQEPKHLFASTAPKQQLPLDFVFEHREISREGGIEEPAPKPYKFGGETFPVHEGRITVSFRVRIGDIADGPFDLKGLMTGQACDEENCTKFDLPFSIKIYIGDGPRVTVLSSASGKELTLQIRIEPDGFRMVPGSASVSLQSGLESKGLREIEGGVIVTLAGEAPGAKGTLRLQVTNGKDTATVEAPFESASEHKPIDNLDAGLAEAKKAGKPVFLEFTGAG